MNYERKEMKEKKIIKKFNINLSCFIYDDADDDDQSHSKLPSTLNHFN